MAYSEELAERVRGCLDDAPGEIVEKKMFGGIAFMLDGNMAVGISGDSLMVRIDPAEGDALLQLDHVREFDMTGKPMRGWLLVDAPALEKPDGLYGWVQRGVAFAGTLPAK